MRIAIVLLGLAYPLLVYFSLTRFRVAHVAVAIVVLAALRLAMSLRNTPGRATGSALRAAAMPFAAAAAAAGIAAWLNDGRIFLFIPALINAALLVGFVRTLRRGPPWVETIARLQVEDLSEAEVAYCRAVTVLWSVFFLANGSVALGLALFGSLEAWTLYNGGVAYVLIATLFAGEFVYRAWRFRRYAGGLTDPVLSRIFPPRETS